VIPVHTKPIRVLIVEDSAVVREHLTRIISADPRLQVAGVAESGEEAIAMVERIAPDVISMDIQLPGMEGFEAARRIMALRPTPIVVVSGLDVSEVGLTMKALRAGALGVVEKPVAAGHSDYEVMAARLCTQLVIMSEVKVIRRREGSLEPAPRRLPVQRPLPRVTAADTPVRLVAIAASTGGPNALLQVLSGLGENFPLPIAVVQHMNPGFMEGFAEWLTSVTPFSATVVNQPMTLAPATVFIAPSSRHLTVDSGTAYPSDSPIVGGHRPSANVLFSSVARVYGSSAVGVLLTGMGEDGAEGLAELRATGAWTIAEDETTAVVYGMPAAAVRRRAAAESLPLPRVAGRLLDVIASRKGGA
jgi:two-component system chemotaxis response regulator CheB